MVTAPTDKLVDCPALAALSVISGKWTTRILWVLREGSCDFGALRRALGGVSAKVLTDHLKALEAEGVILRRERSEAGVVHVSYAYSDYGRTLIPALDALGQWGLTHAARDRG
ncbi:winged helix-turn-helix transcriptional regulator [Aestuariibius sp. 2305UL40-4]|uniref:winged helix-turn-helix transcriptional regulator n=1 Tax=Aestuariibius violaceus TaxID=3234132 RepID=UPI00345E336E